MGTTAATSTNSHVDELDGPFDNRLAEADRIPAGIVPSRADFSAERWDRRLGALERPCLLRPGHCQRRSRDPDAPRIRPDRSYFAPCDRNYTFLPGATEWQHSIVDVCQHTAARKVQDGKVLRMGVVVAERDRKCEPTQKVSDRTPFPLEGAKKLGD